MLGSPSSIVLLSNWRVYVWFLFWKRVLTNIDGCTLAFAQSRIRGSFSVPDSDWWMDSLTASVLRCELNLHQTVNRYNGNTKLPKILIVFNCSAWETEPFPRIFDAFRFVSLLIDEMVPWSHQVRILAYLCRCSSYFNVCDRALLLARFLI